MRRPNPEKLQAQCDAFNAKYPVGQAVTVRRDGGDGVSTFTRSKAEVLSGHSAVIWLEGISGCYLLDRVTPVVTALPTHPQTTR
jgi:hypothetical protein